MKINYILTCLGFLFIMIITSCKFSSNETKNLVAVANNLLDTVPEIIPVMNGSIPSDAITLFDGKNLNEWTSENGEKANWQVKDGVLTILNGKGSIYTKKQFSDCQLHIEWCTPAKDGGTGQALGNSGVWLQSRYEVQILDSYKNNTYSDGQAGAIYKQHAPLVNASLMPGQWQTYDIVFTAPRFNLDSSLKTPAFITVLHNGVIIQNHTEIKGKTTNTNNTEYSIHSFKSPIMLQNHDCAVSFRNIWVRELNTVSLFNGKNLNGWYTYITEKGKDNDPEKNFEVKDSCIHILGKFWGYLCTKKSYSNYYLKAKFKWGDKKFKPKENEKMDSGILYHFAEPKNDSIWPTSFEYQVQEQDCGDYWCIGTNLESSNKSEVLDDKKHVVRTHNFEHPKGEWNTIEIITNGKESLHYMNGHLINFARNLSVTKGKILLQSEGAEIYYKDIVLMPF